MTTFTTNESPLKNKMIRQPSRCSGGSAGRSTPTQRNTIVETSDRLREEGSRNFTLQLLQRIRLHGAVLIALMVALTAGTTAAQDPATGANANRAKNEVVGTDEIQSIMSGEPALQPQAPQPSGIDLLTLITRGGAFMIPIGIMSLLVVALSVERSLSLRRSKMFPEPLVEDLTALTDPVDRFNPSVAMRICQESPSPLSRVVVAMLERTGQPLSDVERAATDALEREADAQAAPIRWLTLAAAATPLMGLLGTVWGMIVAFHESTTLTADRSRSEQLSEGIYTALVTTLAGLVVAIPAAILALYLENRLAKLFHQMEAFAKRISPGLIRFAGRNRMDADGSLQPMQTGSTPMPPVTVPPPAAASRPGTGPPPPPGTAKSGSRNKGGAREN